MVEIIKNWKCPYCNKGILEYQYSISYSEYYGANKNTNEVYKCNKCGKEVW